MYLIGQNFGASKCQKFIFAAHGENFSAIRYAPIHELNELSREEVYLNVDFISLLSIKQFLATLDSFQHVITLQSFALTVAYQILTPS